MSRRSASDALPGRRPRRWTRLRLALAALMAVVALQVLTAAAVLVERARDTREDGPAGEAGFRLPLPDQAAAIVDLLSSAPPEATSTILRAANSPDVRVALLSAAAADDGAPVRRFPRVEQAVQRYAAALGDRSVTAYIAREAEDDAPLRFRDRGLWSAYPMRLDIALDPERVLRIETRGELTRRLFGWPIGIVVGVFGVLVAALAMATIWREAKPLIGLAERLDRFADAVEPAPAPERGSDEVRAVIAAFNRMQTRIAALLKARSAMLGGVSHDLRTYLTRLRLRAEFIADPGQKAKAEADLDAMNAMIDGALALARSEAAAIARAPLDLSRLLIETADAQPAPRPDLHLPDRAVEMLGDRAALARAIDNLARNATLYAGGCEIVLFERDGAAIIDVLDRGPGVPEAEIARLLEPFERGDRARGQGAPGSGLGLAIARNVIEAHGGRLTLENRDGGGLRARATLPLGGETGEDAADRAATKGSQNDRSERPGA